MRIAQVAPLFESVPPKLYGGTERVVSYLTEALVELGHEVTLFASGDSQTDARLIAGWPKALRLDGRSDFRVGPHLLELKQVFRRRSEFDIAHFHTDPLHYPLARRYPLAHLTTLHGRLDLPELVPLMQEYRDIPLVSVSASQRWPLPACRAACSTFKRPPTATSPFWAASRPRSGSTARSRSPRGCKSLCASQPRSTTPTRCIFGSRSSRCWTTRWSSSSARSAKARSRISWAAPRPCCSRSTGPSLSAS